MINMRTKRFWEHKLLSRRGRGVAEKLDPSLSGPFFLFSEVMIRAQRLTFRKSVMTEKKTRFINVLPV